MRWIFRISLTLGLLGLATLAVWPYLPALEREWMHFKTAWAQVRSGDEPKAEAPTETPTPEPRNARDRRVATPPQNPAALPADAPTKSDPFLAETRRRARQDPEATMHWLQNHATGAERLRGMLEVVALWATDDSESALIWLESNAQGLARLETLHSGIEVWAERDPETAAAWIDGMANDGSKLTAAKSLAAKWVQNEPQQAAAWVSGLPDGPLRHEAAATLAESWARLDPRAASLWAFAEAEFRGHTTPLMLTVESFTAQAPEVAEAFLREMTDAASVPSALTRHISTRAEIDPNGTATWLERISPNDPLYSPEHANVLMQVWGGSDSIAASEWLSRQPPGEQRDAAIEGFSLSIQSFEPEAAVAWANSIGDPQRRLQGLEASIQSWAKNQPVEALEWLKNADLEPALLEQLAREIPWD
ncbi:MAG: hypothetical protein EA353_05540 [Puniceicoccaceae bacterium]|nr:MAG: hypothetical protein EA353_05540 [Puniceicoccaceae bacterium]